MKKLSIDMKKIKIEYFLYALAILSFLYFLYTVFQSFDYINNLVKQGQASYGKDMGQILEYLVNNTGANFFYAVSFGVYGYICHWMRSMRIGNYESQISQADSNQSQE